MVFNSNGTIFEDSRGNLWSMGVGNSFQKYDYETKRWTKETSGNNITNGPGGTIFEDSRGNLWSMGRGTPLQKYNYQTKKWATETWSNSGNNIIDGYIGTIFEDSRGNLWSMARGALLQKYNYQSKRWTIETSGNNITNGEAGTIFEDSRGNLWSMGKGTPLQKYDYQTKIWTTETSASGNSNITDGYDGTIFEDSRGNLWSMGHRTPLQKYDYQTKRWTTQTSKSSGNNITNGEGGTIFEDSRGNLWSMGNETRLQKYNYQTKKWTTEIWKGKPGSNIYNGYGGTIFEDSRGNLWSMGFSTPLQKYDYQTKTWTTETSASSNSNITNGYDGTIFEDSRGNLWSMGAGSQLQKLISTKETNLDSQKVKDFDIEFRTKINSDSKITILIKGYRKYTSDLFTHLRYKKKAESSWKVVKKRTMMLDAAEYEFKWVIGTEETLASKNLPQKIIIKSNGSVGTNIFFEQQTNNINKVKAFFAGLSNGDINSLAASDKLVGAISADQVLTKFQTLSAYNSLTTGQKALVTANLITTTEEPAGTLKVTITYGGQRKMLSAPGFLTIAQDNINKVKAFFAGLSNGDINSLAASDKLVGAISADQVLTKFQTLGAYNSLTAGQKALVTTNLITTTKDSPGTLKVTITFKGENYELVKDGFKLSLEAEANKFQDFISNDTTQSKAASLKASSKNVLSIFKTINGYQRPTNLACDSSITNVIVKNALNPQTQKVTFELTVTRQGEEPIKKDINVTFQALKVINKPNKKDPSGLSTRTIVGIGLGSIFGIVIIGFLIFYFAKKSKKTRKSKK